MAIFKISYKYRRILFILLILTTIFQSICFGNYDSIEDTTINTQSITEQIGETFNLDSLIEDINKNVESIGIDNIDFYDISTSLLKSNSLDYKTLLGKILSFLASEIMGSIKGAVTIFFLIIIMAIISNLQLEKDSDVVKIAHLACFASMATITVTSFIDIISMFKQVVSTLTTIMQIISPFLMTVLISTGAITSTGIIQPILLFLASAIGFVVNYVIIPFFSISVAINVVCSISEKLKLQKIGKMFSASSIWIIGIMLTFFLGVLSLETTLTSSVDSLAVKTTQTAVSNFVPVVGKFFSDSFETVVGATKVISNVGGTIGIVSIIIVSIVPIIKIASVMVVYMILSAIVEPICQEESVEKYISSFVTVYKNLLGVLIGITILFVISAGIILNLVNSVVK